MRFLDTLQLMPFLDSVVSLLTAFTCGMIIGAERQFRLRSAGLRTNVLVAVGAAAFVDVAARIAGDRESLRVIAYVVSGVGFLGAGVIMKEGMNVRGLNTAATLWCSAAVGAAAGVDLVLEALLVTVFVVSGNTLLRPLVNAINRIPVNERSAEMTIAVTLTTRREDVGPLRELLGERLRQAHYPLADVREVRHENGLVDIVAVLAVNSVDRNEMEAIADALAAEPGVLHAAWEASASD
ncbi:MgtC/SapB family protein [Camelimonas abortus]|uniref:Protein MgtC n=1 Tax=Camelimonas abortus TaxID=1017184 RepID=A0ABV7LA77_9HYPH